MGLGAGGKGKMAADMVVADQDVCPLCIEALDETERQFFPCPCGYQVCLFCYDRLKVECSNLCPGCRTPYDEGQKQVNQPIRRQASVNSSAKQAKEGRNTSSERQSSIGSENGVEFSLSCSQPPPPPPPVRTSSTASAQRALSQTLQRASSQASTSIQQDTPSSSSPHVPLNWANQPAPERVASVVEQQVLPDISEAWPSLADSTATSQSKQKPAAKPVSGSPGSRQQTNDSSAVGTSQQQQGIGDCSGTGSPSNLPTARATSTEGRREGIGWESSSSLHPYTDHRETSASGASSSHRRPISISIPMEVAAHLGKPDPEGIALLHSIQQAIRDQQLTTAEAASQLVRYLRRREADNGRYSQRKQPLGPPPGFPAACNSQPEHAATDCARTYVEQVPVDDPAQPRSLVQEQLPNGLFDTTGWKAQSSFSVADSIWSDTNSLNSLLHPQPSTQLSEPVVPVHLHDLWRNDVHEQVEVPKRPPGRVPLYARGSVSQNSDTRLASSVPAQYSFGNGHVNGLSSTAGLVGDRCTIAQLPLVSSSYLPHSAARVRQGVSRLDSAYRPQLVSNSRQQNLQSSQQPQQMLSSDELSNQVSQLSLQQQHWTTLSDTWQ